MLHLMYIHSLFRYMHVSREVMGYTHARHITLHRPIEDQPLTATRPSSQGWGRTGGEPSVSRVCQITACHISLVYSFHFMS